MGQRGKLSSAIALQEELLQVNTTKTYILALGSLCCQAGHSLRDHVERVVVNYARQEMTRGEIIGIYFNEANSECVRSEVPGGPDPSTWRSVSSWRL